jgi:hypothetical protein
MGGYQNVTRAWRPGLAGDNPRYSMALLLREALDSGTPTSMARLPMTPEEVAAYDAAERAEDGR